MPEPRANQFASISGDIRIDGLKELERRLNSLPEKIARRILKRAANRGAKILRLDAQARARAQFTERSGKLFRGIKTSTRIKSLGARGSAINVKIGLSPVGRNISKEISVFYGRFLEKGTKDIPPSPFMESAFDARKFEVFDVFVDELRRRLDQVA